MTEAKEEVKKEPTQWEKMNAEGNNLCARSAFHRHIARVNLKAADELDDEIDKLAKKMNNIPKGEQVPSGA